MSDFYWAEGVAGGTQGYLDAIDPTNTDGSSKLLVADAVCIVVELTMTSIYIAVNSAATESLPDIVVPDTNGASWHWKLIMQKPRDEGMIAAITYANVPGAL